LWYGGLEHGDISPWNIMLDTATRKLILNDWDLSIYRTHRDDHTQSRKERTATVPSMALELLKDPRKAGLYRHDLESLIWTLAWLVIDHQKVNVSNWMTNEPTLCFEKKIAFLSNLATAWERIEPLNALAKPWPKADLELAWRWVRFDTATP
jgi:hypothetical protein